MAEGRLRWAWSLWKGVDAFLRSVFDTLRGILRALNVARFLALFLAFAVIVVAILLVFFPHWAPYVLAGLLVVLTVPFFLAFALLSLPFRAKSFVRLVRMGYPDNARELMIRVAARKMHEESIETERLLVETVWNESRKVLARYRDRARKLKRQLDEMP